MSDDRIPDSAIEAAAREFYGDAFDGAEGDYLQHIREKMRETLEAAAPHMLAQAWESGWANARGNYAALYTGHDIPEWVTLRNPYRSQP